MKEKQKDQERKRFVDTVQGWWDSGSKFAEDHLGLLTVIVLVGFTFFIIVSILCGDWLYRGESGSTTVRNLGLIIAAIIAFPLAIWRSKVAQSSLLNERYQKGAEMLGSEVLSVRLGGIYALERLAKEHAEDYYVQIVKLFCTFVRKPPKDENEKDEKNDKQKEEHLIVPEKYIAQKHPRIREDVHAIMTALGRRNEKQKKIEEQERSKGIMLELLHLTDADLPFAVLNLADLSGAWLEGADLTQARLNGADLSDARLEHADLSSAVLGGANLSGAWLIDTNLSSTMLGQADLSGARLYFANLSDAKLDNADLSGADLGFARGLTQGQLDEAVADPPEKPPHLEDAKDSETGKPLKWDPNLPHRLPENLVKRSRKK